MIAILSDIHGNLEALEAVLADVATLDVKKIYCLGDIIGLGPDPVPCIEHAMNWHMVLRGDFEQAAIDQKYYTNWPTASHGSQSIRRFRSELELSPHRTAIDRFLRTLPASFTDQDAFYCHGSPRDPIFEYMFPEEIYCEKAMSEMASLFHTLCFCGHTHLPGIFHRDVQGDWDFSSPEQVGYQFSMAGDKLICNVGSVGQPHDGDCRACYVLFASDTITFRRIEYDFERTKRKMGI